MKSKDQKQRNNRPTDTVSPYSIEELGIMIELYEWVKQVREQVSEMRRQNAKRKHKIDERAMRRLEREFVTKCIFPDGVE